MDLVVVLNIYICCFAAAKVSALGKEEIDFVLMVVGRIFFYFFLFFSWFGLWCLPIQRNGQVPVVVVVAVVECLC